MEAFARGSIEQFVDSLLKGERLDEARALF